MNNPSGFLFADDPAAWEGTVSVDLMAAVRASWKVTPWMTEAGGGAIVHISSIAGLEATGFPPSYCAAKAALVSHANSLAFALAAQKIRVNAVAPGSIEFPGGLWAQARENNPDLYGAVLDDPVGADGNAGRGRRRRGFSGSARASWMTGTCLVVDGAQRKANL